ncbi:hypothetical protein ACFLU6_02710 [Acidobacteriota bacterium]
MKSYFAASLVTLFILVPVLASGEVSVIKAPDGRAQHLLKITNPDKRLIWAEVSDDQDHLVVLNPQGDKNRDKSPVIFLATPKALTSDDSQNIPVGAEFDYITVDSSTTVVSMGLIEWPDLELLAIWPKRTGKKHQITWSSWDSVNDEWTAPEPVSASAPLGKEVQPTLTVMDSGQLLLTWMEDGRTNYIWGSVWTGSGWSAPDVLYTDERIPKKSKSQLKEWPWDMDDNLKEWPWEMDDNLKEWPWDMDDN